MPLIAVASDKFAAGVGNPAGKLARPVYAQLELGEALRRVWNTDAHCVCYTLPADHPLVDGGRQPRLTKLAPPELLAVTTLQVILVDADNPGHQLWDDELRAAAMAAYERVEIPFGVYHTTKGARFVVLLREPVPVLEAEPLIRRALSIFDAAGIAADYAARDWTRHFRLPNVRRAGKPFVSPHVDLARLAPVTLEPLSVPARAPVSRPRRAPAPELPWTPTLADHWQARARQLGSVIREHAQPGTRHVVFLAVAGALLAKGVPAEHVPELTRLAAIASASADPAHHETSARNTVTRYLAGHTVTGLRELVTGWPHVADAVHNALADALDVHLREQAATAPVVPVAPLAETTAALEHTIARAPDGLTVVVAECGLGKTAAAQRVAATRASSREPRKRAPAQTKTAISVDKNELAVQIAEDLARAGIPARRVFGPLSVLDPVTREPVCQFHAKALPLVEGGQSVKWEFCEGRGKYRCPAYEGCRAREGEELYGPELEGRPRVTVGTHALLGELDASAGSTGLLVIDEPPPLLETMMLGEGDVDLALRNVDSFARDYAEAMRPVLLALRDWAARPDMSFGDLTDTLDPPPTHDEDGTPITRPPLRFDAARACRADIVLARTLGAASRTLRALHRAMTDGEASVRLEDEPFRIVVTAPRPDLSAALRREGAVVAMDANADLHLPAFAKVVGYDPPVHRFLAADGAPIERTMLRCGTATRRAWLAHGRVVLDTGLVAAIRGVVAWAKACAATLGRPVRLGIITMRVVELLLRGAFGEDVLAAWTAARQKTGVLEAAKGELGTLFDVPEIAPPILLAHYGATRGLNRFKDVDALATIGDPWPNLGTVQAEIAYLGITDDDTRAEAQCQAELEQAHGRLRTVHRRVPGFALHVGRVLPGGSGWRAPSPVTMASLPGGRPAAGAPMPADELAGIVAALGGNRGAARALGCSPATVSRYLAGRGVPPAVSASLRALAIGVSGSGGDPETPIERRILIGVSGSPS